jgi:hypothetical protein
MPAKVRTEAPPRRVRCQQCGTSWWDELPPLASTLMLCSVRCFAAWAQEHDNVAQMTVVKADPCP